MPQTAFNCGTPYSQNSRYVKLNITGGLNLISPSEWPIPPNYPDPRFVVLMDNRDLKESNPRDCGSDGMSGDDPHSPYLSHWSATYSTQDGYKIDIEESTLGDCYAQWDWTDQGDYWEVDYLPDFNDNEDVALWGMRGCAVGITDSGDYMVAGTARLDMTGYDPYIPNNIVEDYQLFLSVFDDALIDGVYNTSPPSHGIASENWWLFGASGHDEGVSIRQWASGTCLPSNALVVVGTQRRPIFPGTWRIYVCYMPYGSSNDSEELSDSNVHVESGTYDELAVSYSSSSKTLHIFQTASNVGSASLELYDISGRLTGRTTVDFNGNNSIDVSLASVYTGQLPNGVYLAVIRLGQDTKVCNCVVVR